MQIKNRKNSLPRIGIDLMGGDTSPMLLMHALLLAFKKEKHWVPVLFGLKEVVENAPPPFECVIAKEVIQMEDNPASCVRTKKESSLSLGIKALKTKSIDAFVSLGNTGALLLSAKTSLKSLPKVERPAFLTLLPSKNKEVAVIDVGATVSCSAEQLFQFALMGIAYQEIRGIKSPKVGLLNIGTEAKKGTPALQETYIKLQVLKNFVGNIEGRDVFQGNIDVLVTDGFTGNIFLKTAEGTASFILEELENMHLKEASLELKVLLNALKKRLNYAEYPGAILCGIENIVIKCHGNSTSSSLIHGIKAALELVKNDFIAKIKSKLY